MIGRVARFVDGRLGLAGAVRSKLRYVFPEHWTFLFGEIALYSFLVLVVTGTFLALFFTASPAEITYRGSYAPLRGVRMSEAYASTLHLSFDVRAGLLVRQVHHWAALVFIAAILAHLCRVFFTGAFRRPREINWLIGVTLLGLALFNGFSGYSLPDDLLSGTGLRIAAALLLSVPVIGPDITFLALGGEFPGEAMLQRLFVAHVYLVPGLIGALVAAHLAIIVRQHHTEFPGPGRREDTVTGRRLWPGYAAITTGVLLAVAAVLVALGALVQINPIWLYGPYHPAAVSTGAQPDWYLGWLEGALRLMPSWSLRLGDYLVPNQFFPGVALPGLTFAALYAWPFIEARVTGDRREHHLLDRPRDRPVRTAIGVGALAFYGVLFVAGSQDILAETFAVPLVELVLSLRAAALTAPVLAALLAYRIARDLAAADPLLLPPPGGQQVGMDSGRRAPRAPQERLVRGLAVAAVVRALLRRAR